MGVDARKIHGEEGAQLNGGYDDENGSYNKVSKWREGGGERQILVKRERERSVGGRE